MTTPERDLLRRAPVISIILPVLNETKGIDEVITRLREQDTYNRMEIIVVDGDATGTTINAIKDEKVLKFTSEKGRACQMNCGAAFARGDVLLFLHADTLLPSRALDLVRAALDDSRSVAGAFELGFNTERVIFRVTEMYVSLRTRLTRVPFGDQAIFVRRDYFEKIGGYREIPLMEDVELMKRIKKRGDRIVIIPEKVRTSPRRYEQEGIIYCTLRNWLVQALYAWGVPAERLEKWYE